MANSVEDLASNTHRRMRVVSSMHDGNFAIYAETDASEGEHNVDLMITPKPFAAFTMGEHTVFDTTSGEYSNKNWVTLNWGKPPKSTPATTWPWPTRAARTTRSPQTGPTVEENWPR